MGVSEGAEEDGDAGVGLFDEVEEIKAEVLEASVRADDQVADEGGEGAVAEGGDVAGEAALRVAGIGDERIGGSGAADSPMVVEGSWADASGEGELQARWG